jgi:hypothetical protein
MRPNYLRDITEEEKNRLYTMIDDDSSKGAGYRAKIILLRNEGYTVPEIRRKTNHHDNITYVNRYTDSTVMVLLMALHHQGNMVMMP